MLEPLTQIENLKNGEIRNRATSSTRSNHSKHYVAKSNSIEIGFISIDIIPNVDYLVLYEIFVPSNLRMQGYGTMLLREIEDLAKSLKYKKIIVNPVPFEKNLPKSALIRFYQRYGYLYSESGTGELEKAIE